MGANFIGKSKKQPEPDINVTPLVDVVLVLLIIFMVVTPALDSGEPIELPKLSQPDEKPKDLNPIDVTLALNGKVLVEDQPVASESLEKHLRALHEADPEKHLLLNTDERIEYRRVRKTFAMLQSIGFKGVSLKVLEKKKAASVSGQ